RQRETYQSRPISADPPHRSSVRTRGSRSRGSADREERAPGFVKHATPDLRAARFLRHTGAEIFPLSRSWSVRSKFLSTLHKLSQVAHEYWLRIACHRRVSHVIQNFEHGQAVATSPSALRPSRWPISPSVARSGSESLRRPRN